VRREAAAGQPEPQKSEPLALVTRAGNAMRLSAIDAQARQLGLAAGMTLADARARCPQLVARPCDPEADARLLDRLAAEMVRFTPMVALDPPDGLVLDITGCAHLFGGEEALARQAGVATGLTIRHALGSSSASARALARFGDPSGNEDEVAALRRLPVAALELEPDALVALRRAGLTTLGELGKRPLKVLEARFGKLASLRLRQVLGDTDSPIVPRRSLPSIRVEARFAEPLIRTDDALEVIEDLLEQAAQQLGERQQGGRRFVVQLERSDGAKRRLAVETGLPVRDPAVVMRLLRERIETLSDPLDPGFGFDAIRLAVPRTEPLAPRQAGFEGDDGAAQDSISALIDRLGTRLGKDRVLRMRPHDTHIPEIAQGFVPAGPPVSEPWPARAAQVQRPLYLFAPPQPIEAMAEVPDGPPKRFRWRGELRDIRLAEGPERIAAEWWRKMDGHHSGRGGLTRDYYRVEDVKGRRYWVFRHGLFDEQQNPRWYIHGLFP
jgi:protein ImuB